LYTARQKLRELSESVPGGIIIDEFEKETKIPFLTFRAWLNNLTDYCDKQLPVLADYFGVTVDYILGRNSLPSPTITEEYTTFPVIGEVAAGFDIPAIKDWEGDVIDIPTSYLGGHKKEDFFVLRIKGQSMYPMFRDGDKVLVYKQSSLSYSGEIGVVLYDGEMATLKRVEFKPGENWMKLIPINPEYPPKLIENEDLERCYVLGVPKLQIRDKFE
jgi:repressor LexA